MASKIILTMKIKAEIAKAINKIVLTFFLPSVIVTLFEKTIRYKLKNIKKSPNR